MSLLGQVDNLKGTHTTKGHDFKALLKHALLPCYPVSSLGKGIIENEMK